MMSKILLPVWTLILVSARSLRLALGRNPENQTDTDPDNNTSLQPQSNPDKLNCQVKLIKKHEHNNNTDILDIQLCGSIHAPASLQDTILQVTITDITDKAENTKPVHSRIKQWQSQDDPPIFCYQAYNGKLPNQVTILPDWVSAAHLNLDWMLFPLKGKRILRFKISLLCAGTKQEFDSATCRFVYENTESGYINMQQNCRQAKNLAVALALAVSAVDNKIADCEIELIKNWANSNVDFSKTTKKAKRNFEKAFKRAVRFFRKGNFLDIYHICKEIARISSLADRYDILDLCLRTAQADGVATMQELSLLINLGNWLSVNKNKFRNMMEKILPVNMHETEDIEFVLDVNSAMDKDRTRENLNRQYQKWNARVTNSNSKIQAQADQMLELIAKARNQYVG